jgi:hypothetical protein
MTGFPLRNAAQPRLAEEGMPADITSFRRWTRFDDLLAKSYPISSTRRKSKTASAGKPAVNGKVG